MSATTPDTTTIPEALAPATLGAEVDPCPKRWTVEEYLRLAEHGAFVGQRVELIAGEIVEHMSPQSEPHTLAVHLAARALARAFDPARYYVRLQSSLRLGPSMMPEPDVAVVAGDPRAFAQAPTTALLIVEVAVTSGEHDRGVKSSLYAAAGVPEYWIVDVPARTVEVRREPIADAAAPHGFSYRTAIVATPGQAVATLAEPSTAFDAAEFLP